MSDAEPDLLLTCWRDPHSGVLLKQFIDLAEYERLSYAHQDWYNSVVDKESGTMVFVLKHTNSGLLERVPCRVYKPPPAPPDPPPDPPRPPPPDPPYQPSHSDDWNTAQWYRDTDSTYMFPYEISRNMYEYEYSKYQDRYEYSHKYNSATIPEDERHRYVLLLDKHSYEKVPRPMYNSVPDPPPTEPPAPPAPPEPEPPARSDKRSAEQSPEHRVGGGPKSTRTRAMASEWPSVVEEVFAARARADAQRRETGEAARG